MVSCICLMDHLIALRHLRQLLKLALHASLENNAAQFSSIQHLKSISYECGNSICRFWCEQNHPILKPRRFTCVRTWRWSWSNHAVTIVTMCFRNLVGKIRAPRDATQYKTVLRLITPPFGRALAIVLCVLLHARGPYSWIGKTIIKHFASFIWSQFADIFRNDHLIFQFPNSSVSTILSLIQSFQSWYSNAPAAPRWHGRWMKARAEKYGWMWSMGRSIDSPIVCCSITGILCWTFRQYIIKTRLHLLTTLIVLYQKSIRWVRSGSEN